MQNSDKPGTHLSEEETENIYGIKVLVRPTSNQVCDYLHYIGNTFKEENHWFLKEATNRSLVHTMLTDKPVRFEQSLETF